MISIPWANEDGGGVCVVDRSVEKPVVAAPPPLTVRGKKRLLLAIFCAASFLPAQTCDPGVNTLKMKYRK